MLDNEGNPIPKAEEGVWAVSYSDLLMVIMSFFILFFSFDDISPDELLAKKQAETELEKQARVFKDLVSELSTGTLDQNVASLETVLSEDKQGTAARETLKTTLSAKLGFGNGSDVEKKIIFQESLLFASGKWSLSKKGAKKIAMIVNEILPLKNLVSIEIQGHTDRSTPSGASFYSDNFTLSSLRAGAVARQLIKQGIPKTNLIVSGKGDTDPIANNLDDTNNESQSINRRVSLVVKLKNGSQ